MLLFLARPEAGHRGFSEAEEAQTLDEITDEGINGNHAFGFEFSVWERSAYHLGASLLRKTTGRARMSASAFSIYITVGFYP